MLIDLDVLRNRIGVATSCDACGKIHNVLVDHCVQDRHCTSYDAACNAEWRASDHPHACCVCRGVAPSMSSLYGDAAKQLSNHPKQQPEGNKVDATRDGKHRDQETDSGSDQQNQHDSRHVDPFSLRGRL